MTRKPETRKQGRSRRAVLLTIMALGAVVSLSAVSGVFAIFTDRATTGTNSASSRAEAASADLQIAPATFDAGGVRCGEYDEDLSTGIITATDVYAGVPSADGNLCLKNVGSRPLDLSASVIDLVDTDTGCTGDEGSIDLSCGGDAAGELSPQLRVIFLTGCASLSVVDNSRIGTMTSTPLTLSDLAPDAVACFQVRVDVVPEGDSVTRAQSDTATWRFAFDGTAV